MTIFIITLVAAIVLILLSVAFAGVWVYKDAQKRGLQAGMWTLLVVVSGNFIGLILYLLIGRKQARGVCGNCGASAEIQNPFCPSCGEKLTVQNKTVKSNKSLLAASILCIVLSFVSVGLCIFSIFNSDGFMLNNQYSLYSYSSSGYAKKITQNSSGGTWKLSFEEASSGYIFQNKYTAKSKPLSLVMEIDCDGFVQLIVTQDKSSINETISGGSYTFDMAEFNTGKIAIKVVNIDSSNFSGEITVKTD